jgi:hypothetical protein
LATALGLLLAVELLQLVAKELAQKGVHLHPALVYGRRGVFGHHVHHRWCNGGGGGYEVQAFWYGIRGAPHLRSVTHLGVGGYSLGRDGGGLQQLVPPHGHAPAQYGGTEQAEHHLFCLHG